MLPPAAANNGPETALLNAEAAEEMQQMLETLRPEYRAAIILKYWHDMSYQEIAQTLNTTVNAVKSRLFRARQTLARTLRHIGRTNDAAAEYEDVLRYSPDLPNALSNLGMIYAMQGRYLDAVPMFKRLVQLHKDEIAALNLANCYVAMGRYDEAIETYKISLEIAPDQPFTAHALAEAYVQAEDTEAARQWYEKAVEAYDASLAAGASRAQHLGWRAGCLAMLGRYEEAEADVNELLEIAPDRSSPLFNAAQVYALAGDREQAFDYLQRAVEAGYARQQVESDLAFKAFREDPEFRALIEAPVVP